MAPFIAADVSLPICLPVMKESTGISTHIPIPNVAKCVASNTVDQGADITYSIPTCIRSAPQCLTECTEKNQMKLTSFISQLSFDVQYVYIR